MRIRRSLLLIALVGAMTAVTAGPAAAGGARTRLVSVSSTGVQGNAESTAAGISGNGRYVIFESAASNLVPGDTNGFGDVFVRDVNTGTTSRVSVSSTGAQANYLSTIGSISGNGRYVTFISHATNLVPGDTNDVPDVFVRDLRAGTTSRVNVSSTGAQANDRSIGTAISADGRYVTFGSEASNLVPGDTNGAFDVFVRDLRAGTTVLVSVSSTGAQGNDFSVGSEISADGRYVAFTSVASNLVPGDTNNSNDVFVRDRRTGTTSRVSVTSTGAQASTDSYFSKISADGRYVAFSSPATNLVPDDTNQAWDVFVRDRRAGTTTRVDVSRTGDAATRTSTLVRDQSGTAQAMREIRRSAQHP